MWGPPGNEVGVPSAGTAAVVSASCFVCWRCKRDLVSTSSSILPEEGIGFYFSGAMPFCVLLSTGNFYTGLQQNVLIQPLYVPGEFGSVVERTKWDVSGWSLCFGTVIRTSWEALSLLHVGLWLCCTPGSGVLGTRHSRALAASVPPKEESCWPLPCTLGKCHPKARCLKGNASSSNFRYFLLIILFPFQIILVSVPIAQVSVPAAPHRQCQGKMLMLNW